MNSLRNRVQLIGHLGANPELKEFDKGSRVRLSLATSEFYKTSTGAWKETTTWHTVVAWGVLADRAAQQLHKGSFVMIEGKLTNRSYDTASGEKRYVTEVRISSFLVLDKQKASNEQAEHVSAQEEDVLPF